MDVTETVWDCVGWINLAQDIRPKLTPVSELLISIQSRIRQCLPVGVLGTGAVYRPTYYFSSS